MNRRSLQFLLTMLCIARCPITRRHGGIGKEIAEQYSGSNDTAHGKKRDEEDN